MISTFLLASCRTWLMEKSSECSRRLPSFSKGHEIFSDWQCTRGRREAMPNPVSRTWPVEGSIRTFAGLTSLWMRPRPCNRASAAQRPTARRKACPHSIGPARSRSRDSPPGSSSKSMARPWCSLRTSGRTAHSGLSSAFSDNSCSILLRLPRAGRSKKGVLTRIDGGIPSSWRRCLPRYRINSRPYEAFGGCILKAPSRLPHPHLVTA